MSLSKAVKQNVKHVATTTGNYAVGVDKRIPCGHKPTVCGTPNCLNKFQWHSHVFFVSQTYLYLAK